MNHLEHMAPSELQHRIASLEAKLEVAGISEEYQKQIEEELEETRDMLNEHQLNSDFFNLNDE